MIDIETYLVECKEKFYQTYGERLLYMGLQGSYLRGEATENSDVDIGGSAGKDEYSGLRCLSFCRFVFSRTGEILWVRLRENRSFALESAGDLAFSEQHKGLLRQIERIGAYLYARGHS